MTVDSVAAMVTEMLWVVLELSMPVLAASLVFGLAIGIFQTVTSIQEMTLTFVPKMVAITILLGFLLPWMAQVAVDYTSRMFHLIAVVGGAS